MLTMLLFSMMSQTVPAPQAAPPLGGPLVPGMCLLSRQAVFANAKVALAATARLQQIAAESQAEIDAERAPIEKDAEALKATLDKLPAEQRQQRLNALEARMEPIRTKAAQRSGEVEATRAKAMAQISDAAQPLIAQAYSAHKCGLLVDRNTVLGGNFTNDLTPEVVRALDAKMTTISFNRESLPPQPAPAPRP
jgi:Skp family chaperone for outer membrane proteins